MIILLLIVFYHAHNQRELRNSGMYCRQNKIWSCILVVCQRIKKHGRLRRTPRAERPLLAGGLVVAMATVRAGAPRGRPGLSRAGRPRQRQSRAGLPAGESERRAAGRAAGPARAARGLAVLACVPVCRCVCTCVCAVLAASCVPKPETSHWQMKMMFMD